MILTGKKIQQEVEDGNIFIMPFLPSRINPNSYNFTIGNQIKVYKKGILDVRKDNKTVDIDLPPEGLMLEPNRLYLGHTNEIMGSEKYVPIIRGRSSTGRLGLFVHITADLIDIGSVNQWTLMMHAVQPLRIYPGMEIGQVTFWEVQGDIELYNGKYQGSRGPMSSQAYQDFKK